MAAARLHWTHPGFISAAGKADADFIGGLFTRAWKIFPPGNADGR